jgi:hypothetical protein
MTRPTNLGGSVPRQTASGLGGATAGQTADLIAYAGHVGADVEAALDGRPPTHTSASDPTTGDDSGDGHVIGCRWINTASDEEFVVTDVSVGAANWESTTAGGGGSTIEIEDEGSNEGTIDTINFTGSGVSVTVTGAEAEVIIPGGGGGGLPWRQEIGAFLSSSNTNWSTRVADGNAGSVLEYIQSSGAQNDEINFEGLSLEAGTYTVLMRVYTSNNHGIISIQLDSSQIGTIDLYSGSPTPDVLASATGLTVGSDDVYQLKLKMTSKNGSSSNYYGLVHSIAFVRTA